ncbi:MAG: glycosyltransferase family 2 protein [Candidatus Aminicenantia bacterium]
MTEPFVSIVINNYNYARFLKESIDSALNQTYQKNEIIVVDDGSQDESRKIIKSYGGRIIPVFKENGGQASAMNAGFRLSSGEWICFLDSDDKWLPEKISKIIEKANRNPDAIMIYHKVQQISSEGNLIGKPLPSRLFRGNIEKMVLRSGGWWMFPPNSANCFRRDFLQKVMEIPEDEFRICADAYLADLAPFFGRIDSINAVLALYRLHGANYWSRDEGLKESRTSIIPYLRKKYLMYENRVRILNLTLEKFGFEKRVSLKNHWPYQRLRFLLGDDISLFLICLIAIRFPFHVTIFEKLRVIAWILKNRLLKGGIKN